MGNEYSFRVYSQNICGLSEAPGVSKNTALIQKTGIIFKPLDYQEHDFRMAPRVLTPLVDRTVVAGYSTALNCAVRGHPKVRDPHPHPQGPQGMSRPVLPLEATGGGAGDG
ncbi:myosin-binding protein C, fast-type-like, partial [Terrapene carolina triunguis]|uniref:myosin-binding protein C, fast-type-like n=1 Tax=Terrapene triunguis TaxID=2587831 RepID=UPI000E77C601